MILVDTSVIADILTKDLDWFEWSSGQIERWANQGAVCYDAIIFAELSVKFDTQRSLKHRLSAFTCLSLPLNAHFKRARHLKNTGVRGAGRPAFARLFHRRTRLRRASAAAHARPAPRPHLFPVGSARCPVIMQTKKSAHCWTPLQLCLKNFMRFRRLGTARTVGS